MSDGSWQNLPLGALVYMFLRGATRLLRENLPLVFGAGAGVALFEGIGWTEAMAVVLGLAAIGLLLALLHYRRFRFRIDGDLLLVRKGLWEQSELKVRSAQIQRVIVDAPWHLRLFNLVRFSVDTPGGAATEVELPGIRPATADALRSALERQDDDVVGDAALGEATSEPLLRVSTGALVLHGLANNYALVMLAAMTPFLNRLARAAEERLEALTLPEGLTVLFDHPLIAATVLLVALALMLVAASIAIAVLRFHGFTLEQQGGSTKQRKYHQTSGLFSRREQILSASRLQVVEEVQTLVGRLLGRCHLLCRQIGSIQSERDPGAQIFLIPALDRAQAAALLPAFWPAVPVRPTLARVHRHYRRITWIRFTATTCGFLTFAAWQVADLRVLLLALPTLPLAAIFAHLRWLAVGWYDADGWLHARNGLIGHRTSIFPMQHVQKAGIRQTWFQRRRGVADLTLTLASGPVTLPYLAEGDAFRLLEEVLTRIEEPLREEGTATLLPS